MATGVKIGVMGAGAVGCYVGGKLARSGADVVMIGRERLARDIAEHALTIIDLDGKTSVVPRESFVFETDATSLSDRDVVLCCVKSAATADAAGRLASVLRPGAVVVSLQNGVCNPQELRERLKQRVLAGIVTFNIVAKGRGVFRRATSGPLLIEPSTGARPSELSSALELAGIDIEHPRDIRGAQWSKLVINLNNAISALSDRPTKELVLSPSYRRVLAAVIAESLAVLRVAEIRPARIGSVPVTVMPSVLRLPTALVRLVARAQLKIDPEARSSMWEDLTTGRPTEVDYINGEVVRLAESCGTSAPLNRRIVALVHEAERAGVGSPKLSAEALWSLIAR